MPIFIPALIQAGLALARAAIPAATRLLTQAGATAARATTTAGNAMRAAGPIPFVAAGVGGAALTASKLGVVPTTSSQSSSSQSSSSQRSNQPRSTGPAPAATTTNTDTGSGPTTTVPPTAEVSTPEPVTLPEADAAPAEAAPVPAPAPKVVKSANLETILFNDEEFSSEFIVDLLFESVAGQELLTVARNDTVNGQNVVYQPIKNLNILQDTYNPTKLLAVYDTSDSFFGAFAINLRSKIPSIGTGSGGKNYYLTDLGDLVIEVVNIANDEQVEFQVADSGTIDELGI
jgi:hypothetical protein